MLKSQISLILVATRCCVFFPLKLSFSFLLNWNVGERGRPHVWHKGTGFCVHLLHFNKHLDSAPTALNPPPQSHTMLAAFNIPGCQHSYYPRVLTWKCRCRLETPHLKEPMPIVPKPHLELSGCDSASGIEVQGHHHGKAGGPTAVASGHATKGPEDSEGSPELLHCQETEGRCHLCLKQGDFSRDPSWSSFPEVGSLVSPQLGFELQLFHECSSGCLNPDSQSHG